jgi:hypothetical protein
MVSLKRIVGGLAKSGNEKPHRVAKPVKAKPHGPVGGVRLGASFNPDDDGVHATDMRGAKVDGRHLERTGRTAHLNIRGRADFIAALKHKKKRFGFKSHAALIEAALEFYESNHAAKDGEKSYLAQALATFEKIAEFESKARGRLVTPKELVGDMLKKRMRENGMISGK